MLLSDAKAAELISPLLTASPEYQSCIHFNLYELLIQCNYFQQEKYLKLPIHSTVEGDYKRDFI